MLFITGILLTIAIGWIVYKIIQEQNSPLASLPRPPGSLPIIGHLVTFFTEKDLMGLFTKWSEELGGIFSYHNGLDSPRVFISDPQLVKQIMVSNCSCYTRSPILKQLIPNIGNGLFSSVGAEHAWQKKMINPSFSYTNLKAMVESFNSNAANLVKFWNGQLDSVDYESIDVLAQEKLSHLTLDVIGECAFDYKFNTVLQDTTEISQAFDKLLQGLNNLRRRYLRKIIPFYDQLPFKENIEAKAASKLANDTVLKVIEEKRNKDLSDKKDLLSTLMKMYDKESNRQMSDEELQAQVFTFLLAGHETTSIALTWTLYQLALHPDIQTKLREEIKTVLGNENNPSWVQLEELKYMSNVIRESLRINPPVSLLSRIMTKDDVLGGYHVPKGTIVIVGFYSIHHLKEYWDEPEKFNPDRFDKKDDNDLSRYTFLPFSVGPRTCIGKKFALMEMKAILTMLLKNFEFQPVTGFTFRGIVKLTYRPKPPLQLRIKKAVW